MSFIRIILVGAAFMLSGCSSMMGGSENWVNPPMAIPLQSTAQEESTLLKLSQLLSRSGVDAETRAKAFYQRALIYDGLGLRGLAQVDLLESLMLKPDQSNVYNILGIFYTEGFEFDSAYEAFDSALELDPEYTYAERNLAIALYYGERYEQSHELMKKHYDEEPEDSYRAIWLYLIGVELDAKTAIDTLRAQYQKRSGDSFGWDIAAMMTGDISDDEFFTKALSTSNNNTELAHKLTEGYFYLAKRYQIEGDYLPAIGFYKLAIAQNVHPFVEHRYAFLELSHIFKDIRAKRAERDAQKQQEVEQLSTEKPESQEEPTPQADSDTE